MISFVWEAFVQNKVRIVQYARKKVVIGVSSELRQLCTSRRPDVSLVESVIASGCQYSNITRSSATAEIARVGGHYAVQCHSRSPTLVPIDSPYATYC